MTTARNLIELLHGLGVDLSTDGDQLRFVATLDPVKTDTLADLKKHKTEVLSLLRSLPTYPEDTQRDLSEYYCTRSRSERLRMHRRAEALRNEDGIPAHIAFCLSVESERDNSNPRTRTQTLSGPHDADGKTKQPAGHSGK